MIDFENLDKLHLNGVGKYNIPYIEPEFTYPHGDFIPMNYAKSAKGAKTKIVHCFVDDYQFTRYWNRPDDYTTKLAEFAAVCSAVRSGKTSIMMVTFNYEQIEIMQVLRARPCHDLRLRETA